MYFAPLTNRIFNKIKSAIGWELSESQETEQPNEISKTSETEKPEPDYCPQAVSKLKAYQQQHQKLQTIFDEFCLKSHSCQMLNGTSPLCLHPTTKISLKLPKLFLTISMALKKRRERN